MAQKKLASRHQMAEIGVMLAKGEIDRDLAQAIIRKRVEIIKEPRELITVPSLSAAALVARAVKLGLAYLDKDLETWDFITDESGKTYEVLVWKPGIEVNLDSDVRVYFKNNGGFVGNTAVFIAWLTKADPVGSYLSIPEDVRRFARGDHFCVPGFARYPDDHRSLYLHSAGRSGIPHMSFVAFREVKST